MENAAGWVAFAAALKQPDLDTRWHLARHGSPRLHRHCGSLPVRQVTVTVRRPSWPHAGHGASGPHCGGHESGPGRATARIRLIMMVVSRPRHSLSDAQAGTHGHGGGISIRVGSVNHASGELTPSQAQSLMLRDSEMTGKSRACQ